jgi:hypothetical protein
MLVYSPDILVGVVDGRAAEFQPGWSSVPDELGRLWADAELVTHSWDGMRPCLVRPAWADVSLKSALRFAEACPATPPYPRREMMWYDHREHGGKEPLNERQAEMLRTTGLIPSEMQTIASARVFSGGGQSSSAFMDLMASVEDKLIEGRKPQP